MTPTRKLPARVYWFRRVLVLATALALVFAVARVVVGSDGSDAGDRAAVVGARPTPTPTPQDEPGVAGPVGPSSTATANAGKGADKGAGKGAGKAVDQVAPDGPCSVEEVTVTPVATKAPAGKAIPIQLQLTGIRPACTFAVSSAVLAVKVSRGSTRTWSSQDCPSAVKRQSVVVRSSSPVTVQVAWDGRRSTSGQCGRTNSWVLPGKYQVTAAAIGSEPSQGQITLVQPERPVVIKTIKPKPKKQKSVGVSPVTGKKTD